MASAMRRRMQYVATVSLFILATIVASVGPALPTLAAGEEFSAVANKTGKPGQEIAITDLQLTGNDEDEVSVRLHVDAGELWFNDYRNVTFDGSSWGTDIALSGELSEVNYALQNLMYEHHEEGTHTVEVTLGDGNYNAENGHVYNVVSAPGISWNDAKTAAEGMTYGGANGYLATITSQAEHNFILERINQSGWIGASDADSEEDNNEGVWRWATGPEAGDQFWAGDENGTPFNGAFANWNEGEPNDSGENEDGEDCAQISFSGSNGQWNDLECDSSSNQYYVVEFGAENALPAVVTTSFDITLARSNISVNSCDQLFDLGEEYAGDNISLTADIDCHGRTEAPLFDEADFSGTFNGNGFTIKNLVLANEDGSHVGLTGYSNGAEYRNIFLDNITVAGVFHNGVLAGHVTNSIIAENIHATNITMTNGSEGDYSYVDSMGVLFGTMGLEREYGESRIEHVSVQGQFLINDVDYVENIGGLVGEIEPEDDLVIKQAYTDVDITVNNVEDYAENIGGLVGRWYVDGEEGDENLTQGITDSYSWGTINAPDGDYVGGLIGYVDNNAEDDSDLTFTVNNSYSWMDITAATNVGGLIGAVGEIDDEGGAYTYGVSNSFFAGTLNGDADTGIIIGIYEDSGEESSTLDFDNVWYDANKVADYDCVSNMTVDECHAANSGGSQPNYFFGNNVNAPMDEWDFGTTWTTNSGTPPTFKPFIGNDSDQDGINNYIENHAPNNGDANNDGTPDSEQAHVASFVNSVTGQYVSVVVDEQCSLTQASAAAEAGNADQDTQYDYLTGLLGFTADCGEDGYTTSVTLYHYNVNKDGLVLRKYNPNTHQYFTITDASLAQQTIASQTVAVATYSVTDGGQLDIDGQANGIIVDPVGLASAVTAPVTSGTSNSSNLAGTGQNMWPLILSALLTLTIGSAALVRYKHSR